MTSKEIKAALKPMMDFAPAIIRAAEIVAAVERAEVALGDSGKARVALEGEIAELTRRKLECEANAREAKTFLNQVIENSAAKQEALRQESASLNNVCEQKKAEIAGLDGLFAERKKAKELEIKVLQDRADSMRAEIDRLKKQFAAA